MNNDLISISEAKKLGATCLARRNENGQLEAIISLDNAETVDYTFEEAFQKTVCENRLYCPARPQGKWIWRETGSSYCRYGYFTCSNCSFVSKAKQNFCAECGSDMRKGGAE